VIENPETIDCLYLGHLWGYVLPRPAPDELGLKVKDMEK
jgi:hypothetical protein